MKKVCLLMFVLCVGNIFSQKGILKIFVESSVAYSISGDVGYKLALRGDYLTFDTTRFTKTYYLDSMLVKCESSNVFISECKISSFYVDSLGNYLFEFIDFDNRNGLDLMTHTFLDVNNKCSYYSWYYDGEENKTFVITETLTSIEYLK